MPRSGDPPVPEPGTGLGFNEAGAIMPRSGRHLASELHASPVGFNEAGAIMPRSEPPRRRLDEPDLPASMRPGQSCPGVGAELAR